MARSQRKTRKMVTIQDIAADLALSTMTVSRALSGHPDVKDATRQRVEARARELNYRPNRWARSLVTRKSNMIGVVIPEVSHVFFAEIMAGVQDTMEAADCTLILCNSRGKPENEKREIDMLVGSRADGLVVASSHLAEDPKLFAALQREGVPFVLIDRFFPKLECPRVRTDDVLAAKLCVEHMIELGHRRIGMVRGRRVSPGILREEGYREAMLAAGLEIDEQYVLDGDFTVEAGFAGGERLMKLDRPPTAVIGVNDPCAMGVIQAVEAAGLHVPQDVSVVGVGSIESDYLPQPFLTTASWSREEMGRTAAKMLLALIDENEPEEVDAVIEPVLVVRRSTAPPAN